MYLKLRDANKVCECTDALTVRAVNSVNVAWYLVGTYIDCCFLFGPGHLVLCMYTDRPATLPYLMCILLSFAHIFFFFCFFYFIRVVDALAGLAFVVIFILLLMLPSSSFRLFF